MPFDMSAHMRPDLPTPAALWGGFPEFNFVGGNNDPEGVPVEELRIACDRVLQREGKTLSTYCLENGPQGYLPLREFLVEKLHRYAGIRCTTDELLLTSGSLQAIDLINAAMLKRGDTVIVEESNYGGVLSRLDSLGISMVAIPVDQDGMETDVLATELARLSSQDIKPRYIYSVPTVHNPTGTILSLDRRHRLLALAEEYDIPVFEDECYADLVWSGERPPSLAALDSSGRVIHIGSFSKTVAPALRVGYIQASWPAISQLLALKAADAGSGALEQMMLAEYCKEHFDTHVAGLNKRLKSKLDTLTDAIDREFGTSADYASPPGGIFLWLTLPENVDTSRLSIVAAEHGVAINPGVEWSLDKHAGNRLRLCFANPDETSISEGIAKLARLCQQEFGVPVYSGNVG